MNAVYSKPDFKKKQQLMYSQNIYATINLSELQTKMIQYHF